MENASAEVKNVDTGLTVVLLNNEPMVLPRAQRIKLSARVLLELNGNGAYIGNTDNVSESGVFFTIGYPPIKITLGEIGLLHMMPLEGRQPLPCKVARLTGSGIAVQLLENCPTGLFSRLVSASI